MQFTVVRHDESSEADAGFLIESLSAFNEPFVAGNDGKPLRWFVRDADGRICGGLLAEQYDSWLHVRILWVDDSLRGSGLGRSLMDRAESEARSHGCKAIHLSTLSFQARPFYERLGFELVAAIPFDNSNQRFFMRKTL